MLILGGGGHCCGFCAAAATRLAHPSHLAYLDACFGNAAIMPIDYRL